MKLLALALVFASGLAGYAADLSAFGYEPLADDVTGARMWLPTGYTTELKEAAETLIPVRLCPDISWEEGELAGLGVRLMGVVLLPENGGKAEQLMVIFENKTYKLENLVPPEERELSAERLAEFGPLAVEGRVGRYEYEAAGGIPFASVIHYINAGVYVYAFVVKWPRANAAAEEAAERIVTGFSLEEPGTADAAPPSPPPDVD
ncbi:MAG: hypothetical protein PVH29_08405 [Candidatus Zixiibacteriota bacterium]|jgi:hypothetical protein